MVESKAKLKCISALLGLLLVAAPTTAQAQFTYSTNGNVITLTDYTVKRRRQHEHQFCHQHRGVCVL